ncbi:MAG: transporter [Polyangiaceae bacterium]
MRSSGVFFGGRSHARTVRRSLRGAVLAAILCESVTAGAQSLPSFDARTLRPSADPQASLVYEPVTTPGAFQWNVGASLAYGHRSVVLSRGGEDAYVPVRNQLALDLTGGLGIGSRGFVGVAIPLALAQEGTSLPASVSSTSRVPTTALGDLTLLGKANVLDNRDGGLGLAALASFSLPTGNREAFMGEGSATASARALASYSFILAELSASLGYKVRTERRTWPEARVGGTTFGDEIPYTLSLTLRPSVLRLDPGGRQRWEVSIHGALPAGPVAPFGAGDAASTPVSPLMLALSDRIELGHMRDTYVVGGVDLGLNDAVGVPAFRGVVQLGWAPRSHDEDQDGVPDDVDQCRQIPEDRDGFEDDDGCPEIDDDDDGIVDKEDACPRVAGVESRDPRRNGCPVADRDGDGVPDDVDRCPSLRGVRSDDPARNGCPLVDSDSDGIPDEADRCPDAPEDRDGFEDEDGCPDPDNDRDGVLDTVDMCPLVAGVAKANAKRNGCPKVDVDNDTFDDEDGDACPDKPETWNGVSDDDGCPDEGKRALATFDPATKSLKLSAVVAFSGEGARVSLDPKSLALARAVASELLAHPTWSLAIGAKPVGTDKETAAEVSLARAFALQAAIAAYVPRDGAVETVAWEAVATRPSGDPNLSFLLMDSSHPSPPVLPRRAPAPKK